MICIVKGATDIVYSAPHLRLEKRDS